MSEGPYREPGFVCESCKKKSKSPKPAMSKGTRRLIGLSVLITVELIFALATVIGTTIVYNRIGLAGTSLFSALIGIALIIAVGFAGMAYLFGGLD